jgi:hypothetical protein
LQRSAELAGLLRAGARFAESSMVLGTHGQGEALVLSARRIGPAVVFERLWQQTGRQAVSES